MNSIPDRPLVLIVDDDPEFREDLLPTALNALNVRVLKASNVEEGLRIAAQHSSGSEDPLRLVVVDMHMPLSDSSVHVPRDAGVQFLRRLQQAACPVVAVTSYVSFRDCVKVAQAGAAAYIPKQEHDTYCGPEGGMKDLLKTCRKLLSNASAND